MNKVVAIIQARLSSQRLPNKVLLQIPPGSEVSMLELVIRKALLATKVDEVVVVTPDRLIAILCNRWNIEAFMPTWSDRDVVREYYEAAMVERADVIVRVTADCPLTDPEIIDKAIEDFLKGGADIVFNTDCADGDMTGDGRDVEVFGREILAGANANAEGDEREHVTLWMRRHGICHRIEPCKREGRSVNTRADYLEVCRIIKSQQSIVTDAIHSS